MLDFFPEVQLKSKDEIWGLQALKNSISILKSTYYFWYDWKFFDSKAISIISSFSIQLNKRLG